jgi:hypothetical protein
MAKAYLNLHLRVAHDHLVLVKAHIGPKPAGMLGAEATDCFWVTADEYEAANYEAAQAGIEFLLERGELRLIPALIFLKKAVQGACGQLGGGSI